MQGISLGHGAGAAGGASQATSGRSAGNTRAHGHGGSTPELGVLPPHASLDASPAFQADRVSIWLLMCCPRCRAGLPCVRVMVRLTT